MKTNSILCRIIWPAKYINFEHNFPKHPEILLPNEGYQKKQSVYVLILGVNTNDGKHAYHYLWIRYLNNSGG